MDSEPTRAEVDATIEPLVLEFGTSWCGHCRAARPHIDAALAEHPGIAHRRIEDGSGMPLGRSFRVKLWPTLIFIRQGVEVARLVRPRDGRAVADALAVLRADDERRDSALS